MTSAMGHKRTWEQASEMSALPTKADMQLAVQKCPLSAMSGHSDPLLTRIFGQAHPPCSSTSASGYAEWLDPSLAHERRLEGISSRG